MKKNFTKITALAVATVLMTGALSGCGTQETTEDGKVVISVANFADEKTNPDTYKLQMETVAKFESMHPDIKIEDARWDFEAQSFLAKAEGGTLPTVYYIPMTEASNVMRLGLTADLTEAFEERGMKDGIADFILQKISKDNKIYLVPGSCYDVGIAVNIDLYKQAGYVNENGELYQPTTWEDLAEVAKTVKEKTGVDGFMIPTASNGGGWRFTPIAWSYGTVFEKLSDDGKWEAAFHSPECMKAVQYISDLKWKYDVLPENAIVSNTNTQEQFAANNVAMIFAEATVVTKLVQNYGMDMNNIGMLGIPAGDEKRVSLMGGSFYVINKDATPEQIDASMEWLEFQGFTCNLTEDIKANMTDQYETKRANNEMVGLESISPWSPDSEYGAFLRELNNEYLNVDINHIKNYNDKTGLELQEEEPVDAQALYAVFDNIIQQVLTDENADIADLVKNAADDFQKNNLDYAN